MGIACYPLSLSRVLFTHQLTHSDMSRKFISFGTAWERIGCVVRAACELAKTPGMRDGQRGHTVLEQLQQLLVLTHLSISADPQ